MNADVRFLIVATLLLSAGGARAQSSITGLQGELLEDEGESKKDWKVIATLGTGLGLGTFVSNPYSDDPFVGQSFTLQPTYTLKNLPFKPTLSLQQAITWEYTQPGNVNGRRVDYTDTLLGITAPGMWKDPLLGISLGASASLSLPISYASRFVGKVTSIGAGLNASRSLYGFTFLGGFSLAKPFYGRSNLVVTKDEAAANALENDHPSFLCRQDETICAGGNYTVDWGFGANLSATYEVSEKISTGLAFIWSGAARRSAPQDQFTTTAITPSNRPADKNTGTIFVSYSLNDVFSLTASSSTVGAARTADTKSLRFPFFDFVSTQSNLTSFGLDLQAVY